MFDEQVVDQAAYLRQLMKKILDGINEIKKMNISEEEKKEAFETIRRAIME